MSGKKGRGLDYEVAPDLVRKGALTHPDGAPEPSSTSQKAAAPKRRARLDYDPTPFPGALAPSGPSPKAVEALKA